MFIYLPKYLRIIYEYSQIQFLSTHDFTIFLVENLLVFKLEFSINFFTESAVDKKNQMPLQTCLVGHVDYTSTYLLLRKNFPRQIVADSKTIVHIPSHRHSS